MSTVTKELILGASKLGKKSKFWKRVAEELSKPTRNRCEVSVLKLNSCTEADEVVLVPGKVLSTGDLEHKLTIAAFACSGKAKEKVSKHGKLVSISQLMKENPKGKKVRLLL